MYQLAKGWTKAKVLNRIKKFNDGNRAVISNGYMCAYKAPNGNRCFIGCFIPDNHAALGSGLTVDQLLIIHPELKKLMPFKNIETLKKFQLLHDKSHGDLGMHEIAAQFLKTKVK